MEHNLLGGGHNHNNVVVICEQDGAGQWLSMDSEIIMKNGEPIGTQGPTGHYVLLDAHFELPSGMLLLPIASPALVCLLQSLFVCLFALPISSDRQHCLEVSGKIIRTILRCIVY